MAPEIAEGLDYQASTLFPDWAGRPSWSVEVAELSPGKSGESGGQNDAHRTR